MNRKLLLSGLPCRIVFSLHFFLLFGSLSAQTPNSSSYWIANSNTTGAVQTPLTLGNWSSPTTVPSFQIKTTDGGSGILEIHSTREGGNIQFTRADASLPDVNIMTLYGGQGYGSSASLYNSSNTATVALNGQGTSYFNGGNVLIGKTSQTNTSYLLDVNGSGRMNQLVINTTGADFVFDSAYSMSPLSELEAFIKKNHHLPGLSPASEMQKDGMDVGDGQTKLLQKIEELTLYLIEQDKQSLALKEKIRQLEERNRTLENLQQRIEQLEQATGSAN
jgi:hypothetical protein